MEITHFNDPYYHCVIDNFLDEDLARTLANEFPPYDSPKWFFYNNPLENKKTINNWYEFPPETYRFMQRILSNIFIENIKAITNTTDELYPDYGLHGGGWHIQGNGGALNVHLDYNIHPKTGKKRKYNLIIYLSEWDNSWGGNLELWSHNAKTNSPDKLVKTLDCRFNRAVLFDASMNSWHGFSSTIKCPDDKYRKSIASYYSIDSKVTDDTRNRALFSTRPDQTLDDNMMNFIKSRSM